MARFFAAAGPLDTQGATASGQADVVRVEGLDCRQVQGLKESALVVCLSGKDASWEKILPSIPSALISILALVVSWKALGYNRSKDSHARTQSINDDYWLRKVLSPSTTEPLLDFTSNLWVALPPAQGTDLQAEEEVFKTIEEKLQAISVGFGNFNVVDPSLAVSIREHVDRFQDRLTTYSYQLKEHRAGNAALPSRSEALEELAGIQITLLRCIKNHQGSLRAEEPGAAAWWRNAASWARQRVTRKSTR
ncbi:hypothetical protein V9K97_02225 [Variovorax sp. CCNWLW186]|uniref:hypothetical protein n=1 Tax=Variovorax sp. CCNWLW186 TaxID=3127473 RepID=UPI0030788355